MNQRQAKRRVCSIAAKLLWRGGDHPEVLFEVEEGQTEQDIDRLLKAWADLIEELHRRGG